MARTMAGPVRPASLPRSGLRALVVRLHRYAGLATALFLILAGLTGSALAFYHELDAWLNPELFRVARDGRAPLPPLELAARVAQAHPQLALTWLPLDTPPGAGVLLGVAPRRAAAELGYDELWVHPATGEVLGKRQWGIPGLARQQLMPFLYRLHYTLFLPGNWGVLLMGIVALVWLVDCFLGFWLTLPPRRRGMTGRTRAGATPRARRFWQRWSPAWRIKRGAGVQRLNFDLHRAGGLWAWPLLFVIALSSVALNLDDEVFEPVVSFFSPLTPSVFERRAERAPSEVLDTRVSFAELLRRAERDARARGWDGAPGGIACNPYYGLCGVRFGAPRAAGLGNRWLYYDSQDGAPFGAELPGEGTAGDVFVQMQYPLHSGQIAGLPGRIVVCATGLCVAMLSITGIVIWLRKRRSRAFAAARRSARFIPPRAREAAP